jgi:hypothetical protein
MHPWNAWLNNSEPPWVGAMGCQLRSHLECGGWDYSLNFARCGLACSHEVGVVHAGVRREHGEVGKHVADALSHLSGLLLQGS